MKKMFLIIFIGILAVLVACGDSQIEKDTEYKSDLVKLMEDGRKLEYYDQLDKYNGFSYICVMQAEVFRGIYIYEMDRLNNIAFDFQEVYEGPRGTMHSLEDIYACDLNNDSLIDVIVVIKYSLGAGPEAASEFYEYAVFLRDLDEKFIYDKEINELLEVLYDMLLTEEEILEYISDNKITMK